MKTLCHNIFKIALNKVISKIIAEVFMWMIFRRILCASWSQINVLIHLLHKFYLCFSTLYSMLFSLLRCSKHAFLIFIYFSQILIIIKTIIIELVYNYFEPNKLFFLIKWLKTPHKSYFIIIIVIFRPKHLYEKHLVSKWKTVQWKTYIFLYFMRYIVAFYGEKQLKNTKKRTA